MPTAFVVLRPHVIGAAVILPVPWEVLIDLEFSEVMQTGLTPGDVNVELVADGNPFWGAFEKWQDNTHCRYKFNVMWPPTNATVQLKVLDPNLKNLAGGICELSDPIVVVP